jgi:hypothetical protein
MLHGALKTRISSVPGKLREVLKGANPFLYPLDNKNCCMIRVLRYAQKKTFKTWSTIESLLNSKSLIELLKNNFF